MTTVLDQANIRTIQMHKHLKQQKSTFYLPQHKNEDGDVPLPVSARSSVVGRVFSDDKICRINCAVPLIAFRSRALLYMNTE